MSSNSFLAVTLLLAMGGADVRLARAQSQPAPCSVSQIMVDSARDEALSVLTSTSPLIRETRRDLGIARTEDFTPVTVVRDGKICTLVAKNFSPRLDTGPSLVVLRLGPLVFYARDPDQRRTTGLIMDTTYRVVLRLGPVIP
ncbi:MAG TPA: hypothetical protein VGP84_05220 [Gemmatimonadaceae bacterium]|nr:hypothetical protein [Gemmatimonadaceae bacterium]